MATQNNWWIGDSGKNMLRGDPDDPKNPPILGNDLILEFLHRIPQAREDFLVMLPSLTIQERSRLELLVENAPFIAKLPESLPEESDAFMHKMNTAGVYTTGPRGGTGRGRLPR